MEVKTASEKNRLAPINPAPFLRSLFGKGVVVRLKWGVEYKGVLTCADANMNIALKDVEEYIEGECQSFMEELLIRSNNILFIRERNEHDEDEDDED